MNCLNSLLFEDSTAVEAVAGAEVEARDRTGVGMGVLLPSVGATPISLFLSMERKF